MFTTIKPAKSSGPVVYISFLFFFFFFFIGEKNQKEKVNNRQTKEMIDEWRLIISCTMGPYVTNVCTQLRIPRMQSWESFDTNFPMHYIGIKMEKWKKKKKKKKKKKMKKKKAKLNSSWNLILPFFFHFFFFFFFFFFFHFPWFSCTQYTLNVCTRCIQSLKTLALIEFEKSVSNKYIEMKGMLSMSILILSYYYENTPIQTYRKFHLQNWKFSDKKPQ